MDQIETTDSATGRKGTRRGSGSLLFQGGPFDRQIWKHVDCRDHGPMADRACIVIRDDHPDGWPLYVSQPGTFPEFDAPHAIVLQFKGWD